MKRKLQRVLNRATTTTTTSTATTMNVRLPRGIVVSGPIGVGKTHLANVIAASSDMNMISLSSTQLLSKYFGETEKQVSRPLRLYLYFLYCLYIFVFSVCISIVMEQ